MTLYEIDKQISDAWEEAVDPLTGEVIDDYAYSAVALLEMSREEKIEQIALYAKECKAEAEAIKAERLALEKRQRTAERKAESINHYLDFALQGKKFKTPKCSISYRKSQSVSVLCDADRLPDAYRRVSYEADKTAIKDALKAGENLDFAVLVENSSIIVR